MGLLVLMVVGALGFGGCGDQGGGPIAGAATSPAIDRPQDSGDPVERPPRRPKRTTTVRLESSDYGSVLFGRKGGALYLFTADAGGKSVCYGGCARAWPPFIAHGALRARGGVDRGLLGTTRRRDGRRQVTYADHPLYYYVDDPPGEILCHGVNEFGGDWLVVRRSGAPAP
jgi:predicted lipoprotein with Yx(FWY)xxD motif